ncbi:hypothetical protein [Marinobacter sp. JSM 1782161]|uniref:hypothetical protein n=1 Tax=Marinobacter sp. JSM 1782161 TaxID=2685906 RepID=UPI001401DE56|nr:hypothetical protein [Marinobacter sp. JSM 1782161]
MSEHDANSERYIKIARACLRAINDAGTSSDDREQKIQQVYQAIDEAFQAELTEYQQSLAVMGSVLERIASGELSADAAAELARKTIAGSGHNVSSRPIH